MKRIALSVSIVGSMVIMASLTNADVLTGTNDDDVIVYGYIYASHLDCCNPACGSYCPFIDYIGDGICVFEYDSGEYGKRGYPIDHDTWDSPGSYYTIWGDETTGGTSSDYIYASDEYPDSGDDVVWCDDIGIYQYFICSYHDATCFWPTDAQMAIYGDHSDYSNNYGGADHIVGWSNHDVIYGGYGGDTIYGGNGADSIAGCQGDDVINEGECESGTPYIFGGYGDDLIYGGDCNDVISGDSGVDTMIGGSGTDSCYGGEVGTNYCNCENKTNCTWP